MKRLDVILIVLVILLVVDVIMWATQIALSPVQLAPTNIPSRVAIAAVIEVSASTDLADGIDFGSISPPSTDSPADENDNAGAGTSLYIQRGSLSNADIELCIKANGPLTETSSGIATIPLADETYSFASDINPPGPIGSTVLTTLDVLASGAMSQANPRTYYRLWLDVSDPAQAAGSYENLITFTSQLATCNNGPGCPCP